MRYNLVVVDFDGCRFGLKSRQKQFMGCPIKKPWRFAISAHCTELISAFSDKKCNCEPEVEHAPCQGVDTKITENYTPLIVITVHRAFKKYCDRTRQEQGTTTKSNSNRVAMVALPIAFKQRVVAITGSSDCGYR